MVAAGSVVRTSSRRSSRLAADPMGKDGSLVEEERLDDIIIVHVHVLYAKD